MFNRVRIFFALPLLIFVAVAGCATPPPLNFSVPNPGLAERRLDAEVRSITVTLARQDEQVGDIDLILIESSGGLSGAPTGATVTAVWQTALIEAFNRTLIFSDDGTQKVSIAVTVLKLETPLFGLSWTTETVARYEVIDRKNGDVIFAEDIAASGTTPIGEAFFGATRARESINRAVQNNIAEFLSAIQDSNLASNLAS